MMFATGSCCIRAFGRLAGFVSEFVERSRSGMAVTSARLLSLFFPVLAFGVCESGAQERYVTIHHDVTLHSCPNSDCQVVDVLPILSPVYVTNQDKRSGSGNGGDLWTRLTTSGRDDAKVWIPDEHIGYPDRFRPVADWKITQFSYCIGDYCPEFEFTASGEFTARHRACFDGLCPDPPSDAQCFSEAERKEIVDGNVHCVTSGHLYRSADVIRLGGTDSHEFLFLNGQNELCADLYTCQANRDNGS